MTTSPAPCPSMQVFAWEDLDDDNDVLTEYRTYEGHREDITHMAGVYSRIGLGLGFRLGVGTAPPHGRCETQYDSSGACLSLPQSEHTNPPWCAAYASRQLLATGDCEHTCNSISFQGLDCTPPDAQLTPADSSWRQGTTRGASPSGTSSPARNACASSTGGGGGEPTLTHQHTLPSYDQITPPPPLLASMQHFNDASPNQASALPPLHFSFQG